MANGTIKKNVDVNRHTFAFSKTVAANAQIAYSVSAGDLTAPVGRNVRLVLVHQRGNTVQPCYVSWSLGTNIIQQSTDTIVSGYIYNPSGAERTYDLTVSAISTFGGVIARLHRAMSHRWRHDRNNKETVRPEVRKPYRNIVNGAVQWLLLCRYYCSTIPTCKSDSDVSDFEYVRGRSTDFAIYGKSIRSKIRRFSDGCVSPLYLTAIPERGCA